MCRYAGHYLNTKASSVSPGRLVALILKGLAVLPEGLAAPIFKGFSVSTEGLATPITKASSWPHLSQRNPELSSHTCFKGILCLT